MSDTEAYLLLCALSLSAALVAFIVMALISWVLGDHDSEEG